MQSGIEVIRVSGYRSLREVELRPGPLTVMIGANGAGKSNMVRAVSMLPLMRTGWLQTLVAESGGATALLHRGPSRTQELKLEVQFVHDGRRNRYEARLGFAAGDRLMFLEETAGYQANASAVWKQCPLGAGHWESKLLGAADTDQTAKRVNGWLARLNFLHVHDTSDRSPLRCNANGADDQYLRSNGSNLAAFLLRLSKGSTDAERAAWRRIESLVRRVCPGVRELCPTVLGGSSGKVRLDWVDDQGDRFGVEQLSDGTLRFIALATELAQPVEQLPRLICIDEPELGLHPAAIEVLVALARSASLHTQVVFATQSPAILDHCESDEVVVVERKDGATELRRLDPPDLEQWLEDYTLSEVYEKGVFGGLP